VRAALTITAVMLALTAQANWRHLDVAPGDRFALSMMEDYCLALEERYAVANVAFAAVESTQNADNSTGGVDVVTLTNSAAFRVFEWDGIENVPFISRATVATLDARAVAIAPYFLQHWATTNLAEYLATPSVAINTNASPHAYTTNYPGLPMANAAAVMEGFGLGYTTNMTTNAWGVITGGDAYFTRQNTTTSDWALAELSWIGLAPTNTNWRFKRYESPLSGLPWAKVEFDARYYSQTPPVLRRLVTGNDTEGNPVEITVTIQGTVISNETGGVGFETVLGPPGYPAEETVTTSGYETPLTVRWKAVTNMVSSDYPFATNASWAVMYTGPLTLYGDMPWRPSATSLYERYVFVDALRWTGAGRVTQFAPNETNAITTSAAWDGGECPDPIEPPYPNYVTETNTSWGIIFAEASLYQDLSLPPNGYAAMRSIQFESGYQFDTNGLGPRIASIDQYAVASSPNDTIINTVIGGLVCGVYSGLFADFYGIGLAEQPYHQLLETVEWSGGASASGAVYGDHTLVTLDEVSLSCPGSREFFVLDGTNCTSDVQGHFDAYTYQLARGHTVIRWDAHGTNGLRYLIE